MTRRLAPLLLSAPAAVLLVGLLAVPLGLLGRMSLYEPAAGRGFFTPGTWTGQNYAVVTDRFGLQLVGFTVLFGAGIAAGSVTAAYPLALLLRSLPPTGRRVGVASVLLPKLAGPLVTLFGLQHLLSAAGSVNGLLLASGAIGEPVRLSRNLIGAMTGEVYLLVPYAVLVLLIQLGRIDPAVEVAARGLGASRWQTFRRVTLPLSLPGVVLAGLLGLVWGCGAFLGPVLLGGPAEATLSTEVHRQAFEYGRWPRAAADAVLLLAAVGACLGLYSAAVRRHRR